MLAVATAVVVIVMMSVTITVVFVTFLPDPFRPVSLIGVTLVIDQARTGIVGSAALVVTSSTLIEPAAACSQARG
jgi:hypothetical protein